MGGAPVSRVATGALTRSLRAMTVGVMHSHQEAVERYDANRLGELDQQFQIPVSGTAGVAGAWVEVDLDFEAPMIDAYDERQSPYSDPLFTCGVVQTRGEPAFFTAQVRRWIIKDELYVGATLAIGVFRPSGDGPFSGEIHANFQGYGSPTSDSGEDDAG